MKTMNLNNNDVQLVVEQWNNLTATEAVEKFPVADGSTAIGFVYTPSQAHFIYLSADGWVGPPESTLDFESCFEVHVFNENTEIRWVHTSDGVGNAWRLAERENSADASTPSDVPSELPAKLVTSAKLLWGRFTGELSADKQWGACETNQIGRLYVPITGIEVEAAVGKPIALEQVEYYEEDEFGNVFVVDRRYTRLMLADTETRVQNHFAESVSAESQR
ncbi:CRISPR-associated protein [Corynebacterium amycolatum]|nr:CRISPR-associated protein [Corynebacterium amycolatum]